jgi:hypothetical protein
MFSTSAALAGFRLTGPPRRAYDFRAPWKIKFNERGFLLAARKFRSI